LRRGWECELAQVNYVIGKLICPRDSWLGLKVNSM
jgi:hypothetical protein